MYDHYSGQSQRFEESSMLEQAVKWRDYCWTVNEQFKTPRQLYRYTIATLYFNNARLKDYAVFEDIH